MAKCAESPAEYRFSATRPPFFPAEIEFSLYFSLLLVETASHETACTTTHNKLFSLAPIFQQADQKSPPSGRFLWAGKSPRYATEPVRSANVVIEQFVSA